MHMLVLLFLELVILAFLAESFAQGASQSYADRCSREVNDDTPRPFEASLRAGFVRAYKRLFPDAQGEPDTAELKTAYFRCMDGKLLACFVGANLPCNKLDTSKTNRGATAFCRQHPNKDTVPMAATGHQARPVSPTCCRRCATRSTRAERSRAPIPIRT